MLGRAIIRRIVDRGGRQTAQVEVLKGELIDNTPRMQNYGMSSLPPAAGTDCLIGFLGGDRSEGIIIVAENRKFRYQNLKEGEVVLYDDLGNVILLGREGISVIAKLRVDVTAPDVEVVAANTASIVAGGSSITITGAGVAIESPRLTHNGVNIGASHTHSGVQTGNGNTGMTNP
jgi:phage baseplate assembly protein V